MVIPSSVVQRLEPIRTVGAPRGGLNERQWNIGEPLGGAQETSRCPAAIRARWLPWIDDERCAPRRCHRAGPDPGGRGAPHRGADRGGHLDRQRHPRLPRSQRAVDQEPQGRAHLQHRVLRDRPRGATAGLAGAPGLAGHPRASPTTATAPWSPSNATARSTPWSPRTSTVCTRRRAPTRPGWSRSTAPSTRWCASTAASRIAHGRHPGPGPRRRGRPGLPALRRHAQVGHHLVRPEPGRGRPGPGPGRRPRPATCCWRSAPPSASTRWPPWCPWPPAGRRR